MEKLIRHNIGDKVIALNDSPNEFCQFRVKGNIYTVLDTHYCSKCGIQSINIGTQLSGDFTACYDCKHAYDSENKKWTISRLFVKVDDIEELLTEAISNEDYELASTLRDLKL